MSGDSLGISDATPSSIPLETARPSLSKDVFVSYASQDAVVANSVVEALEKQGIRCWIAPRDVTPGALYADEIVGAINGAKVVVLLLSEHSITSPHVGKEIERASSKRRRIIAFHVDSAPLTRAFEYFLSESQWIDVGAGGTEAALPKLVEAVRRHLDPTASMEPRGRSDPPTVRPASTPRARWLVAGGVIVLVALGYFAVDKVWISKRVVEEKPVAAAMPASIPASPAIPEKSVAVLPFVDMSEKKDQEYFADGLSEELIDHLAHAPDLKVIARTSSFQFKGKNEDMRTIGQKLGVANVLEGSVRTSGKTLRVTAQLIKVTDGSHLWSQTYDRAMGDVFAVQDSIAAAVAIALKAAMATQTSSSPYKSNNPEAYAAFLRGRFLLDKNTKDDTDNALAAFEEAARLDPSYAAAWAGIAATYDSYGLNYWMPPMKAYAKAKKAVDYALRLDPNLVWAHQELGAIKGNYLYDSAGAKAEYERIRELDPTNDALIDGWEPLIAGQFDESIKLFRLATQRDPLNPNAVFGLANALFDADRQPEAESTVRRFWELNPSAADLHCLLGWILLAQHKPDAALAAMSEESEPDSRWCKTDALWALGRRAEADTLLAEAKEKFAGTRAYSLAQSYARRNEKDEAFKWLNRAYENHESSVPIMKVDLPLKNLRGDPRFTALLHKMNMPE
jgi:adenylate cyclase